MHPGLGLWLRAHVCKAIQWFVGEVNTIQVEIETDLNQQENVKDNFIVHCKNGFEKFKWSLLTVDIYISRKEGSPEIKVASSWASGRYLMRTEDPCPKNIPRKFQFFLWGVCIFSRTALSSKLLQVIYQTQKNEKKVENMTCSRVFFNQSQVFGQ